MTTEEKLKNAVAENKKRLIALRDGCASYCRGENEALSQWEERHQEAEDTLSGVYELIREPVFRERISQIRTDPERTTEDPEASFNKIMYFIARVNALTPEDYVMKWNKHYCYQVLETVAREYSALRKYMADVKEEKRQETAARCEDKRAELREEQERLWFLLLDNTVESLVREKVDMIVSDCAGTR